METKWLEDFLSLAETRSFSRSAQLRRITQPAFSRRIQALEAWAGTDLVDRSSYPTRLTAAGEAVHAQAIEILASLQFTSNLLHRHMAESEHIHEFAVPHSLSASFFPQWIGEVAADYAGSAPAAALRSRSLGLSEHDAALRFSEGTADFLMVYHHPSQPLQFMADRYDMISVADDLFGPYAAMASPFLKAEAVVEAKLKARHALPGTSDAPLPFLGYTSGTYLGRLTEQIVRQAAAPLHLHLVYETEMAEGLAAMAAHGLGVAFLPQRVALATAGLAAAVATDSSADPGLSLTIEIRLYRERPETTRHRKPAADAFWKFLLDRP
jgi:DNA-binding transcriptional LysR family regulator